MSLKKQIGIAGFLLLILIILRIVFANAQSELPIFLSILMGAAICYMVFLYLFKTEKLNGTNKWSGSKITIYGIGIILLTVALNYTSGIHDHALSDSIWIDDHGNAWVKHIFGTLLAILVFYIIFSSLYEHFKGIQKLKYEKSTAELALLKNQINPHFFFNTLNNLYSLIKKNPDAAQEYVLRLSDVMRFTIYDSGNEQVGLEDEITYLRNFIALQTARYHKKIEIDFHADIKNPKTKIAPLLFIVLLENAFKHGVEQLTEGAFIHVKLKEIDTKIGFSIVNNFDGEVSNTTNGIGLQNLSDRLHLVYPNAHELSFEIRDNTYAAQLDIYKG